MTIKRISDLILAVLGLALSLWLICLIAIIIRLTSKGGALHWSKRVGLENSHFKMPKFRTMRTDAPLMATHLMVNPDEFLTPFGRWLRRYSLDELPQLFSVLLGDMSLVGPRPALFNQDDLIELRVQKGLEKSLPGITGWAQVNGRDELSIPDKVALDFEYLQRKSFWFDLKILFLTIKKVFQKVGVAH